MSQIQPFKLYFWRLTVYAFVIGHVLFTLSHFSEKLGNLAPPEFAEASFFPGSLALSTRILIFRKLLD